LKIIAANIGILFLERGEKFLLFFVVGFEKSLVKGLSKFKPPVYSVIFFWNCLNDGRLRYALGCLSA